MNILEKSIILYIYKIVFMFKGTFLVMQSCLKAMKNYGIQEGSIVNVASIVGKLGNMGQCNYSASKAGVEGLTKSVAKEFGP